MPSFESKDSTIHSHLIFPEAIHLLNYLGYSEEGLEQCNIFSELPGWKIQPTVDTHPTKENLELLVKLLRWKNEVGLVNIIKRLPCTDHITNISTSGSIEKVTISITYENKDIYLE